MVPYRSASIEPPTRSNQHWCNLCNAPCSTDEALREHYWEYHPEAAALLEHVARPVKACAEPDHPVGPLPRPAGARRQP
jgi:hypothetical protein